jgi:GT2 family glycosyltransferase
MAETPRASIIIPTYKRENLLRNLLESLSGQKASHEYDVTVVGDGTEVSSEKIGLGRVDMPLKFLSLPRKAGRGAARNAGIKESSGDIVIFLDDDMTVVDGFVDEHVRHFKDENTVVIGDILSPPEYAGHSLARYIQRQGIRKLDSRDEIPLKCFRTGNALVSRGLLERVGMFDETITHYGEDMDLAVRLADAGARFVFAEGAAAYHHHPPDISDMILKMREYGKYTVPVLVERHPYLRRALRIHLAEQAMPGREPFSLTLKKLGLRLILTAPVYGLVLAAMQFRPPDSLMFPMYDYVRAYNYITEYWKVKRYEARRRRRERGSYDITQ